MPDETPDRFKVLIGPEEYKNHILDTADADHEAELDRFGRMVSEEQRDEFETLVSEHDPYEVLLSLRWTVPGDLLCNHSSKTFATAISSLSEYAAERRIDEIDVDSDGLEGICSHCWSTLQTQRETDAERDAEGVPDRIGTVGYRLRWKQKGRAREEWYDIVVRPETTLAELDTLVCRFTTLDDFHLRLYGLEDEYLDSSLNVLPDTQYEMAGDPSYTKASELTIAEVADRASLWEGDRLTLVYDFGTPSHYYCIVKAVYEPDELDSLLAGDALIAETDTAAIVDQKRP